MERRKKIQYTEYVVFSPLVILALELVYRSSIVDVYDKMVLLCKSRIKIIFL